MGMRARELQRATKCAVLWPLIAQKTADKHQQQPDMRAAFTVFCPYSFWFASQWLYPLVSALCSVACSVSPGACHPSEGGVWGVRPHGQW
jgi:hypothetical protein